MQHFVKLGLADSSRVGICGWSYGGYMSAMALARAPETFHVGIAGAPVTHWDGYDTHYTEVRLALLCRCDRSTATALRCTPLPCRCLSPQLYPHCVFCSPFLYGLS